MSGKIIIAWESPTNEDTAFYKVGKKQNRFYGDSREWTVGRIEVGPSKEDLDLLEKHIPPPTGWGWNTTEVIPRIEIYDTDGNLRVSLPAAACAVECETD